MSLRYVAEELGVSHQSIRTLEEGVHQARFVVVAKYAKLLDVSLDYLAKILDMEEQESHNRLS
jgi:transcriptional regulator with XRE-family HTH domain